MMKKEALALLHRLLVEVFFSRDDAQRLADQSGVNRSQIRDADTLANYWWNVLVAAHQRNKVEGIVKNASRDVDERAAEFKEAYRAYADAKGGSDDIQGFQTDNIETQIQLLEQKLAQISKSLNMDQGLSSILLAPPLPDHVNRQLKEMQIAEKEVVALGVRSSPKTAYQLGMVAARRRDYDAALDYFQQAADGDPKNYRIFDAIAWLQQSLAMDAIQKRDFKTAEQRLNRAESAAEKTDPLDSRALALRGNNNKCLAQIAEGKQENEVARRYYTEASRLFQGGLNIDSKDASAWLGLGNVRHGLARLDANQDDAAKFDPAIEAYEKAIAENQHYTAAYHDLSIAYEDKFELTGCAEWRQKALTSWREAYRLAPKDAGFTADKIVRIGNHILQLEQR